MAAVLSVGSLKGGTGKSTVAINVAAAVATSGRRVALLDADSQRTASDWAAAGRLPMAVEALPLDDRAHAERWLTRVAELGRSVDAIVIDLPPHLSVVAQAALIVTDVLVVPVGASGADLLTVGRVLDLVREAQATRGDGRPRVALLPSKIDRRTATGREAEDALRPFGVPILPALGYRTAFVDALTAGLWVGEYAPNSTAAAEVAAVVTALGRRVGWPTGKH